MDLIRIGNGKIVEVRLFSLIRPMKMRSGQVNPRHGVEIPLAQRTPLAIRNLISMRPYKMADICIRQMRNATKVIEYGRSPPY